MRQSIVVAGLLAVIASSAAAQGSSIVLEVSGGAGFTSVDVKKWGGSGATNEEQLLTAIDLRAFLFEVGGFQLGAEAGYRYFFYYETAFGPTTLYRDIDANRFGVVVRRSLGKFVGVDAGAATYQFPGGSDLGVSGALVFRIPLGAKLSVPLHVRADVVLSDPMITAPAATAGLSFKVR